MIYPSKSVPADVIANWSRCNVRENEVILAKMAMVNYAGLIARGAGPMVAVNYFSHIPADIMQSAAQSYRDDVVTAFAKGGVEMPDDLEKYFD